MNGRMRWQAPKQPMGMLTAILSMHLGKPVTDTTGLKGKYDFSLFWAVDGMAATAPAATLTPPENDTGPTLITAVQEQLGLRLEQKKDSVDILVIDHVERVPTDN